jgi:hypothetical protein
MEFPDGAELTDAMEEALLQITGLAEDLVAREFGSLPVDDELGVDYVAAIWEDLDRWARAYCEADLLRHRALWAKAFPEDAPAP